MRIERVDGTLSESQEILSGYFVDFYLIFLILPCFLIAATYLKRFR